VSILSTPVALKELYDLVKGILSLDFFKLNFEENVVQAYSGIVER
jgi:hypothetical protein